MKFIDQSKDDAIIRLVQTIMGNGTMVVETVNEALLVRLMELRGTPIRYRRSLRDIDKDYEREMKEQAEAKEYHRVDARKETD